MVGLAPPSGLPPAGSSRPGCPTSVRGVTHRLLIRPLLELGYFIAAVVVGAVTFTVVVTGISLSVGLLPLALIGLPMFTVTVWATHWAVAAAGRLTRTALGEDIALRPMPRPEHPGLFRGALSLARSGAVWKEMAFAWLLLPLATLATSVVLSLWSAAVAGILLPAYIGRLPGDGGVEWLHWGTTAEAWAGVGAGLVLAVLARLAGGGFARLHVALTRGLLSPGENERLRARVSDLQETRARVVDAADAERRRIERDLHDGAQQHLVSLAMNLGRARTKLDDDLEAARELIARAHEEAKDSIAALRDVVRGVHPAVLTDRGLDAALSALAARSPVPVRLRVDLAERCGPTAEAIAYFVVSEALTNAAKHAEARHIEVHVEREGDRLLVAVSDDGRGGATDPPGGGLSGLRDRVAAVDGTFRIDSPAGAGTTVSVELPCAS